MRLKQVRTGKLSPLHSPQFFFARDRALAEEAFAGDVVGIPHHGTLRIGDTLSEAEELNFVGVPYFAPEILRRVHLRVAMKVKKLRQALQELGEEGVVQLFLPRDGSALLVGVVGTLQLDVLQSRLKAEYGIEISYDTPPFQLARWVAGKRAALERFLAAQQNAVADDVDGDLVFLATSPFMLRRTAELKPALTFRDIKDFHAEKTAA
jgi:peptide chain release factor 3